MNLVFLLLSLSLLHVYADKDGNDHIPMISGTVAFFFIIAVIIRISMCGFNPLEDDENNNRIDDNDRTAEVSFSDSISI